MQAKSLSYLNSQKLPIMTKEELRRRRKALGLRQQDLATFMGVHSTYLSQVEIGHKPISEKFSITARRVLEDLERQEAENGGLPYAKEEEYPPAPNEQTLSQSLSNVPTIPVVGMAAACNYDPSLSNLCDLWELSSERVPCICEHSEGLFGLRISGESMEPVLKAGDIVAVSDTLPATGNICVAMHRTDGVVCKRWYWRNGVIRLEALNPDGGKTYEWTKEQFKEEQPLVWRFRVESLIYRKLS